MAELAADDFLADDPNEDDAELTADDDATGGLPSEGDLSGAFDSDYNPDDDDLNLDSLLDAKDNDDEDDA